MKRYLPILLLLMLFPFITTVTNINSKYVTVGIERGAAGVFVYNNESNGYLNDIFREWAKYNKKTLLLTYYDNSNDLIEDVKMKGVDFGLVIADSISENGIFTCVKYQDEYSVSSTDKLPSSIPDSVLIDSMRGKTLYVSPGATRTIFYNRLISTHNESIITFDDSVSTQFSIDRDILIRIHKFKDKRIQFSRKLQDTLKSTIITSSIKRKIRFDSWYKLFVDTKKGAAIVKRYTRGNFFSNYMNNGYIKPVSGSKTSKYDDIFKEIAAKEDLDWHLLSAIAFVESKYHNDVISPNGAIGLMQIMPQTGAVHGKDKEALLSPYVNVQTAAKHLHTVARKLKINGKDISKLDRLCILVAAYNCGHGHLQDVLNLTIKAGKDPNKWEDVSFFLSKMNDPEYYKDPKVKFGKFGGSHTVKYVGEVMSVFNNLALQKQSTKSR